MLGHGPPYLSPPYAIWSIWRHIGFCEQLLFLALCVLGVYFLFSVMMALTWPRKSSPHLRARSLPTRAHLSALQKRTAIFEKLLLAAFYLFGLALFVGLQQAYLDLHDDKTPVVWLVVQNFAVQFAYAANVFFVFLVLHLAKWFVEGRVSAYSTMLKTEA